MRKAQAAAHLRRPCAATGKCGGAVGALPVRAAGAARWRESLTPGQLGATGPRRTKAAQAGERRFVKHLYACETGGRNQSQWMEGADNRFFPGQST
jgi:hypothetical protein